MPSEASSGVDQGAVNDRLADCDLALLQWGRLGPARCSARSRTYSAIRRASSTGFGCMWVATAQPARARGWTSAANPAQMTAGQVATCVRQGSHRLGAGSVRPRPSHADAGCPSLT
jgi:hypothetical protein